MLQIAKLGRVATQAEHAQVLRSDTQRRQRAALKEWRASEHPSWLTEEIYRDKIKPALRSIPVPAIASALNVSLPYATQIRAGRCRPHPRHWEILAQITGVQPGEHRVVAEPCS
jgi:hypothetical protein